MITKTVTRFVAAAALMTFAQLGACPAEAHHPVGAMGPRQLPAGARQGLREGLRRQGRRRGRRRGPTSRTRRSRSSPPRFGLRHGRRRLAVARRRLDRRPLRRPDRVLQEVQGRRVDGAGDGEGLCRVPGQQRQVLGRAAEGDANGFSYRKDWFEDPKEKAAFKAKYKYDLDVPKTWKELGDIAEFFHRPPRSATASRSTPTTATTRW